MKATIATIFAFWLLVSASDATTNGLVAAYGFEELEGSLVEDASGNGNTGTIVGAVRTPGGRFGKALSFTGDETLVRIPDSSLLHLSNAMTLQAWVFANELGGWRDIIYKGVNDTYYLAGSSYAGPPGVGGGFASGPLLAPDVLPPSTWIHLAATYDGSTLKLYVNGNLISTSSETAPIEVSTGNLTLGGDEIYGQHWIGSIDEVRIYNRALTRSEIQLDMATPIVQVRSDHTPPNVSIAIPSSGATLSHVAVLSATATDDQFVAGVDFRVDGAIIDGASVEPYTVHWNTTPVNNGLHILTAIATDAAGNQSTSAPVQVTIRNPVFVNEVVVPDIVSATTLAFLPDGRMLVGELTETIWVVQTNANTADPVPALQMDNSQIFGEQGLMDIVVDPNFSQNHYIYVFYTRGFAGAHNRNRVSRFTVTGNSIAAQTEFVLWQDNTDAEHEHHGGALGFGLDGKLYITVGDQFVGEDAQNLQSYRGKLLRINRDGSIPSDNPFYDGAGPNLDEVWALGLRNPFRMFIDPVTGTIFIGDVGGNDNGTSMEEINIGVRGANYGWPLCEGYCDAPDINITHPLFAYPHSGRDACVVAGFVYRGSQFPPEYYGNFFFADYVQNWVKRLILNTNGTVADVIDFEPPDGTKDGPYGDPVKLVEAPDGSLYYVDIGFNDSHVPNPAAIRRIRYVPGNRPPVAMVSASPASGAAPLTVSFSSAGSSDPEGSTLSYEWQFGDGSFSTQASAFHTYSARGEYTARLRLSDGVNTTLSSNLTIAVGAPPVATISSPQDGITFRGGDVIRFAGTATDLEDGSLPDAAFTWTILFHHEGHIHPGGVITNTSSGTFLIPTTGHDFQGATSYEIILSVTDSDGLKASDSVTIFPEKVNVSFDTAPSGFPLDVAGIRRTAPFIIDALIGFQYQINAPQQSRGGTNYQFLFWSDAGAQSHMIVVPAADVAFVATYGIPVVLNIQRASAGGIQLNFKGTPDRSYRVEASSDLKNWQTIGTVTVPPSGAFEFDDAGRYSQRFYRTVIP